MASNQTSSEPSYGVNSRKQFGFEWAATHGKDARAVLTGQTVQKTAGGCPHQSASSSELVGGFRSG